MGQATAVCHECGNTFEVDDGLDHQSGYCSIRCQGAYEQTFQEHGQYETPNQHNEHMFAWAGNYMKTHFGVWI